MPEWMGASYMEIYILRHGMAEEAHGGMRDADRALTEEGKKKLQSVLRRAHAVDVEPAVILTSPYRRARETAEVAVEALRGEATLVETSTLIPDSLPEAVWEEIRTHKSEARVMIVGHEPLLSSVYAYLLGAASVQIDVKKGSLGRVDVNRFSGQPRGVLRWLIYPKLAGD
jgi:phosphohistidine phosphatase